MYNIHLLFETVLIRDAIIAVTTIGYCWGNCLTNPPRKYCCKGKLANFGALEAPSQLRNRTLNSQRPKMGLQEAPQALRWLKNSTLKNQGPNGIGHEWGRHESPRAHTQPGRSQTLQDAFGRLPDSNFLCLRSILKGSDLKTLNPKP